TDRRLAEARLRASEEALRKADQRKDEFLATLSHELRNPLAPIRTAAEMLTLPNLSDEQLAWPRQVIYRQVEHMARLLDDLLDVARITRGKLQLRFQPVDLGTIVDTAVEAARPLITARKHGLTIELPPDLPTFAADPVRLAQVLSNLLTNAAKYTDSPGRIALAARVEGGMLRIAVKDNGIGISPGDLPDIFEMSSQVQDGGSRAEGGLGIGLALVKGLVTLHGGDIEVFSEGTGYGSEFVVTLPCEPPAAAQAAEVAPAAEAAATTVARKILVADDNQDAANTLAMLLRLSGHDVRTAHGGEAALTLASAFQPDIALLDIGMPDLNGYEVARQLRRTDCGKDLRLIALTGWGQDEDKRRALDAGFDHHLTKPVDPRRLDALLAPTVRD
ncbi:MAG TPA: ATP-binding protein, partial [Gammaproteobacteria bacterium]|nr:ATP-binding protein [Gammaproteobacteria bacterium]